MNGGVVLGSKSKVRISCVVKENLRPLEESTASLPPLSSGFLDVPCTMQQLHSYDGHRTLCSVEDKATAGRLGGHSWNIISNNEQDVDLTCFLCAFSAIFTFRFISFFSNQMCCCSSAVSTRDQTSLDTELRNVENRMELP